MDVIISQKKPDQEAIAPALREEAMDLYRKYLQYECGEIRLDGMPADDKAGSKVLELEKLFIPTKFQGGTKNINLSFANFRLRYSLIDDYDTGKQSFYQYIMSRLDEINNGKWGEYHEEDLAAVVTVVTKTPSHIKLSKRERNLLLLRIKTLIVELLEKNAMIPSAQLGFRRVILAGPGGGKTTLMKRLATAYAFYERREDPDINDHLPKRDLLPIWIRCRDLKEKVTCTLNEIIRNIPLAEFPIDRPELATALIAEIFDRISTGRAILLIDGLDEIADTGLRSNFASQIARFSEINPNANIIVTSRISGFEHVSNGKLSDFPRAYISQLDDEDIRLLCRRWHKVIYGDREEINCQADALAKTVLTHEKIRALAGSPLLLTTLLLVQRRVGRLPTKRVALYDESVKVLLETWNQEAHKPLDLDTAKCQLAYVAFEMMRAGIQVIGRKDLEELLEKVRKEQSWLPSVIESPGSFLDRVELRSSLLAKRGYNQNDVGTMEEEYEFQHLTFQEYLAAFAVVNGYYAGADHQDSYIDVLKGFYGDENKEEVVLLATAQSQRKEVTCIVASIIESIDNQDRKIKDTGKISVLRNSLMKIVLDEVQLVEETRNQIFTTVVKDTLWYNQIPFIRNVLKSNLEKEFRTFLKENNWEELLLALDLQESEDDPIGKCVDSILAAESNTKERKNMLAILSQLLWVIGNYTITNRMKQDDFLENTFNLLTRIAMESENELILSADCMFWLISAGCGIHSTWIPDGFTKMLIHLIYKNGINLSIRLFAVLPIDNENAGKYFYLECPQEVKQFFTDKLHEVNYPEKKGVFWASVFVGIWDWEKSEIVLEEIFADEDEDSHNSAMDKLRILRKASESIETSVVS